MLIALFSNTWLCLWFASITDAKKLTRTSRLSPLNNSTQVILAVIAKKLSKTNLHQAVILAAFFLNKSFTKMAKENSNKNTKKMIKMMMWTLKIHSTVSIKDSEI